MPPVRPAGLLLLLLLMMLLCATHGVAPHSDFDPGTEQCVCMAGLADCSGRGLVAFSEDQLCDRSVTALDLSQNELTAFPQVPARLQLVNASRNRISVLAAVQGLQLAQLDLARNALNTSSAQPLRQLASLQLLDVSHNRLDELTFLPEPCALRQLAAAGNRVSDLEPALACGQLERLQLAGNQLTELPADLPLALEELDVSDNLLENFLDLGQLASLRRLNLSNNLLEELSVSQWPEGLEELDLSRNYLEALPPELGQLPRLRVLDASGNRLLQLPRPGPWPALQRLSLAGNEVRAPAADRLRALLDPVPGKDRSVDLRANPLQPGPGLAALLARASAWSLEPGDVCCGSLSLGSSGLQLCLAAGCDRSAGWAQSLRPATTSSTSTTVPPTAANSTPTPLSGLASTNETPGSGSEYGQPSEWTQGSDSTSTTPSTALAPEPPARGSVRTVLVVAAASVSAACALVAGLVCLYRRHRRSTRWRLPPPQPRRGPELTPLARSASRAAPRVAPPPADTPRSLRVADERFLA